jgi:3-hydroxyacyl-CoA dehydrogenase/enoyl-CoA hydratase/3-hydroxybutyryl-CoA epimerase
MTTDSSQIFSLVVDGDGIATLTFDLPGKKVNVFTKEVMIELERQIDSLAKRTDVKALLLRSGKPDSFIAGADVRAFAPAFEKPELLETLIRNGHNTFNKIENLPFPTIALIHGACLGGGLECALAFKYRVATDSPKTIIGLPETTLGIIPGWGGSQRLPRLTGLAKGLEMILSGRPLKGVQAYKCHLVDALVAAEFREEKVREFIRSILKESGQQKVQQARKKGFGSVLLEDNPLGRSVLFSKARKEMLKKTKGHYLAPEVALNLLHKSYHLPLKEGLELEIQTVLGNAKTGFSQSINLIDLFLVSEELKKNAGVSIDAAPKEIKSAAVIGAGTMGAGIAWLLADRDRTVRLKDLNWDFVGKGISTVHSLFAEKVKQRKLTPGQLSLKFHHITGAIDYTGFNNVDIAIEAAVEDMAIKKQLFSDLETHLRSDAIIVSNTSSLSIKEMASSLKHPERFLGLHFFNPVNKMPLVEVIPSAQTSQVALATAIDLCRKLGKTPIVVADCAGFLVNRVFMTGANEVMWMFQEGVPMAHIEKVLLDFGMPMSPFALADEVGNDVCYKVAMSLEKAYGDRMRCPEIVALMAKNELYGKKNGKGFYIYRNREAIPNPEAVRLVSELKPVNSPIQDRDIKDRVVLAMINEAARCLEEKVVVSAPYLDMAMIMGTGFPPFTGGLLKYADSLGIDYVMAQLKNYQSIYGPRFNPAALLTKMEEEKSTFWGPLK